MYDFGVFFRKTVAFFLLAMLLIPTTTASELSISAESAILIDADSGECIFAKNADAKRGMASTTKIMTAVIAIENGDLDAETKIPDAAIGVEGSSLYLQKGESMTLRDLLYGLMLRSANDAAEAIAITVGGSIEAFAQLMNQKAVELGLNNTHFSNPHGLADDAHYTTARELAKLTAYALNNDTFGQICSSKKQALPGDRLVVNHNKMLFTYEGACGVKTGFTKATGRCLVSAAERDGVRLIAVTLNAPNDWKDHSTMLDYGFATYESVALAKKDEYVCSLPIIGGDEDSVDLKIGQDIGVCLTKKRGSIIERIELLRPRFAPVYVGDAVGRVVYILDGIEIASAPLYAAEHVGVKQQKKTFLDKIKDIFG